MVKKSNKQSKMLRLACTCLEVALIVAAIVMLVAPAVVIKNTESTFSGANVTFGLSQSVNLLVGSLQYKVLEFSFMNLVTYILLALALVFLLLKLAMPKQTQIINLLALVLLAAAGVFFFLTVQFTIIGEGFQKVYTFLGVNPKESLGLGVGSILGASFSLVAAVLACGELFLLKK